jgi:hypothetical protein
MRVTRLVALLVATTLALAGFAATANASSVQVVTRHKAVTLPVVVWKAGEAVLDLTAAAPDTDWAVAGRESAVLSVSVDGTYATDIVVTGSSPLAQQFVIGQLSKGVHRVQLRLATDRSSVAAKKVVVSKAKVRTYSPHDPEYQVLKYAPIVYGRTLPQLGSPFQNATTDTPLLAWHERRPAATPGHTILEYSVIWSNEDGGTNTPALMARWGRTTDIEWIYRVELDADGKRVGGSDVYQAANHATLRFAGAYQGDHAKLETCTVNNNMCDQLTGSMRFFLSPLRTRPTDAAREVVMDANPWSYQVMAKELIREGKIEAPSPSAPSTPEVSDQRNYLFAIVKKTTEGANSGPNWVGVALTVKLKSGATVYTSNHVDPTWSIQRNDPAATTVELPAGTTQADIESIGARRVVVGTDSGAAVNVTRLDRGFFLGTDYLPQPSFLSWTGSVTLTAAAPDAVLWTAP